MIICFLCCFFFILWVGAKCVRQRIEGATLNGHFSLSSCRPLCWKVQSRNLGGECGKLDLGPRNLNTSTILLRKIFVDFITTLGNSKIYIFKLPSPPSPPLWLGKLSKLILGKSPKGVVSLHTIVQIW